MELFNNSNCYQCIHHQQQQQQEQQQQYALETDQFINFDYNENDNCYYFPQNDYSDGIKDEVPLIPNGTGFLPQLAQQQQHSSSIPPPPPFPSSMSGTSAQTLLSHLNSAPAGINDKPLEFNHKNSQNNLRSATPSNVSQINDKNNANQQGSLPMDLDNDNEALIQTTNSIAAEINKRLARREQKSSVGLEDDSSASSANSSLATKSLLMPNDMILNGLMPPLTFPHMMLPGMLMDPQTMAAALQQMQQFQLPATNANTSQSHLQHSSTAGQEHQQQEYKKILNLKSCTLYPPNPNAPPPTLREKPPGCRTVFVGGLPENITEDIIREIFETYGEITTLRLSKKNFCHIRYAFESSVDSAIALSGYRIRISNSDLTNCGRLHVDYAQARDDQYEWECKQRQLQREQRHRERMERDRLRSQSPQPIHYTEHEACNIAEKLKSDDNFVKAVQTLITWLDRGDCSKKNSNQFYTMIQSTNAHIRRLQNDRNEYEDELKKSRETYRKRMLMISQQFTLIEKVFNAALKKKVWDHFTKAQRKNIDQWKKVSLDMRSIQIDDDEMEMSDDDRDHKIIVSKRSRYDTDQLKEENDSLRCQLEAYKNEMSLLKSDSKCDSDMRDKQMKVLQEAIRNLQTQLLDNKNKEKDFLTKINDLEEKLKQANVKELLLKTKIANNKNSTNKMTDSLEEQIIVVEKNNAGKTDTSIQILDDKSSETGSIEEDNKQQSCSIKIKSEPIDVDEARIIALVSTFLVVHPFGASPDYICSYLQKSHPNLRSRDLEEILTKYRTIFVEEITGIGMKIERKWKFCGFDRQNESASIQINQ